MKFEELKAEVIKLADGICVDVFAVACNEDGEEVTLCYEEGAGANQIHVYDGRINMGDPGEGPIEEYADRGEALGSEYCRLFKVMFTLADGMVTA